MNKKFVSIKNKQIAYLDEGEGHVLLFIHGNPTSSYLWRNVINPLKNKYRCIAPDLIGMGDSDKLDLVDSNSYSFQNHKSWLKIFIEKLQIQNKFTLVIHDWGSALGFDYAKENPNYIEGIVYMEAIVCPLTWDDWPEDAKKIFKLMRSEIGEELVLIKNIFIEKILPSSIIRKLSDEEMRNYRKPFLNEGVDRQPMLSWPRQIPINESPKNINNIVKVYSDFMSKNDIKKLFINAEPGSILTGKQREFCRKWKNQKEVTVKGIHFIQEDSPESISKEIDTWIKKNY
ncbi:haloalkane dehalogenase [Alphaproteobacteria bacterium]|nr:haloalkane dehalogenase [Alphaproteobacteria bacterium]